MKIGIVGTIWLDIPPQGYGGTESMLEGLVNGLVEKGHDVTFFGASSAKLKARIIPTVTAPLRSKTIPWENIPYHLYHFVQAFENASDFDILHVQLNKAQDYISLPLGLNSQTPLVYTTHFTLPRTDYKPDRLVVLDLFRHFPYTSISDSQKDNSRLNFIQTIYNGTDINNYPFSDKTQDYFVWLGRIRWEKGTKEAILAAKKLGVKLYVLGAVDYATPEMLEYFEQEIKPLLDGEQIIFVENADFPTKTNILKHAKALLNPIKWKEAFGMVMIESLSCGTPVIAYPNGAAVEIVENAVNGFLVKSVDEMVEKMKEIQKIKRLECRKYVEEKFSTEKMVLGYEKAYQKVIENWDKYRKNQKEYLQQNKLHPAQI